MDQHWLTIFIVVALIVGIVFDGVRRMRKARSDSLRMKLNPTKKQHMEPGKRQQKDYGGEFPNGGARVSSRTIDSDRIKQVRNRYNFGSDMSTWGERVAGKLAEHRGKLQSQDDDLQAKERIEPSVDVDPLMDNRCFRHRQAVDTAKGDDTGADSDDYDTHGVNVDEYSDDLNDESFDYELYDKAEVAVDHYSEYGQNSLEAIKMVTNDAGNNVVDGITAADVSTADELHNRGVLLDTPIPARLNLDDSVPMLMDTFNDKFADKAPMEAQQEVKASAKISINPFTRQILPKNTSIHHAFHSENNRQAQTAAPRNHGSVEAQTNEDKHSISEEVLVIHVRAVQDYVFYGDELLELILEQGLRFGAMDIFHRHVGEDGAGPILFSLSNMVKPGVFDLHSFDEFSTVGVSLFLSLPVETGSYLEAFEAMLSTAKAIAKQLQGELKDENRNVLTGQTVEHYRERIRDFSRRARLEKRRL
jgi:cell division protein ZipA